MDQGKVGNLVSVPGRYRPQREGEEEGLLLERMGEGLVPKEKRGTVANVRRCISLHFAAWTTLHTSPYSVQCSASQCITVQLVAMKVR